MKACAIGPIIGQLFQKSKRKSSSIEIQKEQEPLDYFGSLTKKTRFKLLRQAQVIAQYFLDPCVIGGVVYTDVPKRISKRTNEDEICCDQDFFRLDRSE